LYFMNGALPKRCAASLAEHLPAAGDGKAAVEQAFMILYGRAPTAPEIERSIGFLRNAADTYATHGVTAAEARTRALDEFVRALFATNEFMFID